MRKIPILMTLLLVTSFHCLPHFGSLKNLRERSKHLMGNIQILNEGKRGASIKFAPKTDFLYPGLDQRKIEKVKKLWQDYYDCQQALYDATQRLVVPEALAFLEGSNAVLECEVCESPRDIFTPTQWFYSADYDMDKLSAIVDTPTIFMRNHSLYIYNVADARGGLYICTRGPHSARPYVVNIFSKEKTRRVGPEHNKESPHPATDAALPELNATVTTVWAEWTQCSRCDYTGKKFRTGICTVVANKHMQGLRTRRKTYLPSVTMKSLELSNETKYPMEISNQTTQAESLAVTEGQTNKNVGEVTIIKKIMSSSMSTSATKAPLLETKQKPKSAMTKPRNETLEISPLAINLSVRTDLELLDMFEEGIPCRSQMLSEHTRGMETVANRSSEVMVAYCKLSCPKSVLFVVVDDKGEVLETANNSEGIYSVKQGLPQEFPAISRIVQFATYGKSFKIKCPGNRNGDIPIEWYVGKKILTNTLLEKETHGRITIDAYNRIIFDPVLYEDSRVLSCWQRKELVGTVRLLVEKEHFILNFQSPVTVIGTIIIFATFSWVYYKAFTLS